MMNILSLFLEEEEEHGVRGSDEEGKEKRLRAVQAVLEYGEGDCHASQRISFACALYLEARGMEEEALAVLEEVTSRKEDGDVYMREMARNHLRVLGRRLASQVLPCASAGKATRSQERKRVFETPRVIKGGWQLSAGHTMVSVHAGGGGSDGGEGGAYGREEGRPAPCKALERAAAAARVFAAPRSLAAPEEEPSEEAARTEIAALVDLEGHAQAGITAFDAGDIYTGVERLLGRFWREHHPTYTAPRPIQIHTKCVPTTQVETPLPRLPGS